MLTFYYAPLSANARRVWIALLEKQIAFAPVLLKLDGDQFQPEFTAINPLQRVPAIVDNGLRLVESLAILDYLEAKYPNPTLMPTEAEAIGIVRMVEMVSVNELQPATLPLMKQMVGLEVEPAQLVGAQQRILKGLSLLEEVITATPFFMGEALTLADLVAGTIVPSLPRLGVALDTYPKLMDWQAALAQRDSFQRTAPTPEQIEAALPSIKKILQTR